MGKKARRNQLRQWRAREARHARACLVPRYRPEFRWPADRDAVVAEVLAAADRRRGAVV
jgi:hypothetical protein